MAYVKSEEREEAIQHFQIQMMYASTFVDLFLFFRGSSCTIQRHHPGRVRPCY